MQVTLIARPQFIAPAMASRARDDQMQGSDGAKLIEFSGRICYDSLGNGRASKDYHAHILEVKHGSVCEHAQYSFLIQGVSRNLTHELIRHRAGTAISQRSTRFVDEAEARVVKHPGMDHDNIDVTAAVAAYKSVAHSVERKLLLQGVAKSVARKQARAAAARYLPHGIETELVWSANVRALLHVIAMRGTDEADAEIRQLAGCLCDIMARELPEYFGAATYRESADKLAPCVDGLVRL